MNSQHPYLETWSRQLSRERALQRLLDLCHFEAAADKMELGDSSDCEIRLLYEEVQALNRELEPRGLRIEGWYDNWEVKALADAHVTA
jgi:hypothetical protein